MATHLYYRLKSYLRKRSILDHYGFNVNYGEETQRWSILHWNYNIPQPDVSEVPDLSPEEYFVEQEDTNYFTNDVYKVDRACQG